MLNNSPPSPHPQSSQHGLKYLPCPSTLPLSFLSEPEFANVSGAQESIPPVNVAWPEIPTLPLHIAALNSLWARICQGLSSPGIDYKKSIPPANVAGQAGTSNSVGNRFLGSLKGLQIRALGLNSLDALCTHSGNYCICIRTLCKHL